MDRRTFCLSAAAAAVAAGRARTFAAVAPPVSANGPLITLSEIEAIDRDRILRAANEYLMAPPITITASSSPRSKGGKHDYFSEADYWWPDPKNLGGPYIERDGYSDPQNFNDHRLALIRLSVIVPALTAAWLITQDKRYAERAAVHLRAWFLAPDTRMNPSLDYAQAVWGHSPGRSYGIIDTLHLVEVTRAARHLQAAQAMTTAEFAGVREWFTEYLLWMRISTNGQEEEAAKNNHGTCWTVQAAAFAAYIGNENAMLLCRERFRNHLLPDQMAEDGSFPLELKRSKPYNYSLFDLDMLAMVCVIASASGVSPSGATNNLWQFALPNGNLYKKAVDFMFPYIEDKSKWPYPHDVEYFDDLPNRQPSLLFAGLAYREPKYIALWRTLPPDPKTPEIVRNFPIRQPVLWVRPV
ncbi:MAG: alginate lyase family protein [Terracidiphilus sp.]